MTSSSESETIRTDLLISTKSKVALNRAKQIVLLNHDKDGSALEWWSEYFALLEILDEKQFHIVNPVIQDKGPKVFRKERGGGGEEEEDICSWQLVVVAKMMGHDNRDVVKTGFLQFIQFMDDKQDSDSKSTRTKKLLTDFLLDRVLPLLRNHVGWIFPDAQDLCQVADRFGNFLTILFEGCDHKDLEIAKLILEFLTKDGTSSSSAAAYFLIRAMEKACGNARTASTTKETSPILLEGLVELMTKLGIQSLHAIYTFIRYTIELTLLDVMAHTIVPLMERTVTECEGRKRFLYLVFGFYGSLSQGTITERDVCSEPCLQFFTWFGGKLSQSFLEDEEEVRNSVAEMNILQLLGFVRLLNLGTPVSNMKSALDTVVRRTISHRYILSSPCNEDEKISIHLTGSLINVIFENEYLAVRVLGSQATKDVQEVAQATENCCIQLFGEEEDVDLEDIIVALKMITELETLQKASNVFLKDESCCMNRVILPAMGEEPGALKELILWKFLSAVECSINEPEMLQLLNLFTRCNPSASSILDNDTVAEFYKTKFVGMTNAFKNTRERLNADNDLYKALIRSVIRDVDKAGFGGILNATKCIRSFVDFLVRWNITSILQDSEVMTELQDYLNFAWKLTFELRKAGTFWESLEEFSGLLTHHLGSSWGFDVKLLSNYGARMFDEGETTLGLPLPFMKSLCSSVKDNWWSLKESPNSLAEIVNICLEGSIRGPALPKNFRVIFSLWEHLSQDERYGSSDIMNHSVFNKSCLTRLLALRTIELILERLGSDLRGHILSTILNFMMQKNNEDQGKKYFGSSLIHRKKQRVLQTLLVLHDWFDEEHNRQLLLHLLETLSGEHSQPTVRYFTEWLIVRILSSHSEFWDEFVSLSKSAWNRKIGYGMYFSSICLHTCQQLDMEGDTEDFFGSALLYSAQLAVSHHSTVRAYSQVCFQKIFKILKTSREFGTLVSKYEMMYASFKEAEKFCTGTAAKVLAALENDFYIQAFNPKEHHVREVVFLHLPRLSEIANDEIATKWCMSQSNLRMGNDVGVHHSTNSVSATEEIEQIYTFWEKKAWHLKIGPVSGREMGEEYPIPEASSSERTSAATNFQKKINPWLTLNVSEELEDSLNEDLVRKKREAKEDGLIVVASLIDKLPNLGGLCRSCEIFGVSKYVIPTFRVLDDQQFHNLSVTAHQWIDLIEVPPQDLASFLASQKAKGYRILGIEQAEESKKLNEFKFPKKSLLLLGSERHGIPPELLQLVDDCLEIPQVGVIRSLNVHVTGALCIWQYSSQHVFPEGS